MLARYLAPLRAQVALLVLLLLTGAGVQLTNPQVVRGYIDAASAGSGASALLAAGGAYLGLALAGQVVSLLETYFAGSVGWRATNALRSDLAAHCLALDPAFHTAHSPGELIERIDGDVSQLASFFSRFAVVIVGNLVLLLGVLALSFREDWRVGALFTLVTALTVGVSTSARRLQARYAAAQRAASAALFGLVEEGLVALPDVQASGAQAYLIGRVEQALRAVVLAARRAVVVSSLLDARRLVGTAGTVALLLACAALYRQGQLTLGAVYLLLAYRALLSQPISQITRQIGTFQQASASLDRVRELLGTPSAIHDRGTRRLPAGRLGITFERVSFAYGDAPVLRDVSFDVPAGQVLGLVGRTGSGKTSLTRLLFRLYEPQRGAVLLGGVDVRDAPLAQLRQRIGLVTQDVQLFHASVRDNVTLFDPSVDDARVEAALEEVGLGYWMRRLPRGLASVVGPGGSDLSSGEAQLLACARLFVRDPDVVVLDEATARVDPETERRVQQGVQRLLRGRTGLVIAHRLDTVWQSDAILVVEDGRAVEHGPPAMLAADPGSRFAALLRAAGTARVVPTVGGDAWGPAGVAAPEVLA